MKSLTFLVLSALAIVNAAIIPTNLPPKNIPNENIPQEESSSTCTIYDTDTSKCEDHRGIYYFVSKDANGCNHYDCHYMYKTVPSTTQIKTSNIPITSSTKTVVTTPSTKKVPPEYCDLGYDENEKEKCISNSGYYQILHSINGCDQYYCSYTVKTIPTTTQIKISNIPTTSSTRTVVTTPSTKKVPPEYCDLGYDEKEKENCISNSGYYQILHSINGCDQYYCSYTVKTIPTTTRTTTQTISNDSSTITLPPKYPSVASTIPPTDSTTAMDVNCEPVTVTVTEKEQVTVTVTVTPKDKKTKNNKHWW